MGFALPGMKENLGDAGNSINLPETFEVTADVKNFSMETSISVVSSELFANISNDKLSSLDGIKSQLDEFANSANKLADGSSQLYDGLSTLLEKTGEIKDGTLKLYRGAESLNNGAKQFSQGTGELYKGTTELNEGLQALSSKSEQLNNGAAQIFDSLIAQANTELSARGLGAVNMTKDNYSSVLTSIIKNMVAFAKSDITFDEAMKNFICETGSSATAGYATTFSGSAIKGIMQNSTSQYIRTLSKTNLPGTLAAVTISVGKSLTKYFKGEIDGVECMQELGQEGANMVASAIFATIGQIAIPIPVVGGLIGGMLGYSISAASFGFLKEALENEKIARENRIKIEEACYNYIQLMDEYKIIVSENINNYLYKEQDLFSKSFEGILDAAKIGDIDWFIDSANNISLQFGKEPIIKDKMDFLQKMESDETIII